MKTHTTRIAIPVQKDAGLNSTVSAHFGKSRGFIVVDSNGENYHYLDTQSARQPHECAPIRALVQQGSRVLLCHSMGRGALSRSHEAGLRIHQTNSGRTITDTLENFRAGKCPDFPNSALCSHAHHHNEPSEDET